MPIVWNLNASNMKELYRFNPRTAEIPFVEMSGQIPVAIPTSRERGTAGPTMNVYVRRRFGNQPREREKRLQDEQTGKYIDTLA
jgi:hypothetical protein